MARELTAAVLQCALGGNGEENHAQLERLARAAAQEGATLLLLPELFAGPYFCTTQDEALFATAAPVNSHPSVVWARALSRELKAVIPASFFERHGQHYYNSCAICDQGEVVHLYRKSHVPDGPGYQEKFYFRPGRTGFQAVDTSAGRLGLAICWDQWFPEAARLLALDGAELLLYPTAIGTEPHRPELHTKGPWRRVMQGHSAANAMPLLAANRIGTEGAQAFYGASFITNGMGAMLAEMGEDETGYRLARFDLDALAAERAAWGFFRDRRPELYGGLSE